MQQQHVVVMRTERRRVGSRESGSAAPTPVAGEVTTRPAGIGLTEIRGCACFFRVSAVTDRRRRRHDDSHPSIRSSAGSRVWRSTLASRTQYYSRRQCFMWHSLQNFKNRNQIKSGPSTRTKEYVRMDKDHALEEMMGKLGECH